MAESDSWWNSFLNSAKEKSMSAINVTKRDLTEFMTTVTRDTSKAVSGVAGSMKSYMQQTEGEERNEETVPPTNEETRNDQSTPPLADITVGTATTYDRSQTLLETLRSDPNTYCTIPQDQSESFSKWCDEFNITDKQEEISKLLVTSNSVRKLHAELVPSKVSYESFWLHYFYRIYLLEEVDVKRAKIMERVHSSQGQLICWDDEEEDEKESIQNKIQKLDQSPLDKAMTDSSESFVCISEEGIDGGRIDEETPHITVDSNNESPPPIIVTVKEEEEDKDGGKEDNSDSDWEKWDD